MSLRVRALSVCAILCFAVCWAHAQQSLSLGEYKTSLDLYQQKVQELSSHPEFASDLYNQVPASTVVQTESGSITVPLEFLREGLVTFLKSKPETKPSIISEFSSRLRALRAEADNFQSADSADTSARERVNRILAAREFRGVHGPTEWELLQQRISAWLDKQFDKISPKLPDLDQLGQIVVWIAITVVCSVLAIWLYRRSRERLYDRPREVLPFLPSARSWQSWIANALAKAASGEWREAIHLGFWAAVSRLETDGVWRPDQARTPREYLNAMPRETHYRAPFASIIRTFEAVWYGGRPASSADFDNYMADLEKLGCHR